MTDRREDHPMSDPTQTQAVEALAEADVEALRELLRGAKCACGHDAEWHSGMLGCNAEDYTIDAKPCECREDWVGAVAPLLAADRAAQRRAGAEEAANEYAAFRRELATIFGPLPSGHESESLATRWLAHIGTVLAQSGERA